MNENFDKYLAIANHDIQMAKNMGELKNYVASILYDNDKKIDMIHELEEEIKEYQKALDEITSEKIDLYNIIEEVREYINNYEIIDQVDYDIKLTLNCIGEMLDKGE